MDLRRLSDPFPASDVEWRVQQAGKGNNGPWALVLAYITNRAIMDRLDEVCGPENWRNEFKPGPEGGTICGISIRVGYADSSVEWCTKWDGAENTDIEAVKGGLSGAMKRAGVQWGIGRYLYNLEEGFAKVSERGANRAKTKEGESFRWDPPQLPKWALPGGAGKPNGTPPVRQTAEKPDAAALDWIREVGSRCEDDVEMRIGGATRPIKAWIRENWPAMKSDAALVRTCVEAIEASTGEQYRPTV